MENSLERKRTPENEQVEAAARRSKKGKSKGKNRSSAAADIILSNDDFVRAIPLADKPEALDTSRPVQLSEKDKAAQLRLSEDKLSVSGSKGYRTVRCTHGAHEGAWYCEVKVEHLGLTGHCRLGWCTKKAELQAPVGTDRYGFSYRDLEGTKVHKGLREPYGEQYAEGDVIGLLIYLPPGGRHLENSDKQIVRYKSQYYYVDEAEPEPQPLQGSFVAFMKNGVYQGNAYQDILEGRYYPSASVYSRPDQSEPVSVTFNFGPDFKYPLPSLDDVPPFRAFCELSNPPQTQPTTPGNENADEGAGDDGQAAAASIQA